jgi:hypothetical protein
MDTTDNRIVALELINDLMSILHIELHALEHEPSGLAVEALCERLTEAIFVLDTEVQFH